MRHRWPLRRCGWPLLLVALLTACEDDKTPSSTGGSGGSGGTGGSGGSAMQDSGPKGGGGTGGGVQPEGGTNDATTPPPGDGGLVPCLELPTDLDRPPSGQLPCDLLPPGFVAP